MTTANADVWEDYAWKSRVLIVYAPDDDAPELAGQRTLLSGDTDAMRERDLVLIEVVGDAIKAVPGPSPDTPAAELRARHGISPDQFGLVLVGKDTGVKLRSDTPVASSDIFSLIDAMPMRRREMLLPKAVR